MSDRAREANVDDDEEEAPIISPREVNTTAQQTKKNPKEVRNNLSPTRITHMLVLVVVAEQSRRALPAGWWVSTSR